jgi:uncharacterized peroxidase-related enzyme
MGDAQLTLIDHDGRVAHIDLGVDETQFPGIIGPMQFRPETAKPLNELAETLLRTPHPTLSPGERELIAAYVSGLNDCDFCCSSHSAFAAAQLDEGMRLVQLVRLDPGTAPISAKMKALLRIAGAVQKTGKHVTSEHINMAREAGATDLEIHDTVLIAAAFCMYNRYVDGLGTLPAPDESRYALAAQQIVQFGYRAAPAPLS